MLLFEFVHNAAISPTSFLSKRATAIAYLHTLYYIGTNSL